MSVYGGGFDGNKWPWTLDGDDGWYALHDATGRYISDACVEGDGDQMRGLADALRKRENFSVKRCALRFEEGGAMRFWSPRNSMGGENDLAKLDAKYADELADIIEKKLAETSTETR